MALRLPHGLPLCQVTLTLTLTLTRTLTLTDGRSPTLYNGLESYVAACIKAKETSFYPLRRALELSESPLSDKPAGSGGGGDVMEKDASASGAKKEGGSRPGSRSSSFALGASRSNLHGGPFGVGDLPGVQALTHTLTLTRILNANA